MGKIKQVINYRTSGTSLPSPSNMEFGELAIQYNSGAPKLIIKKADGTLAEFVDWNYILDAINQKAAAESEERETADKTLDAKIESSIADETARTESTYLKEHQSLDAYYTSAQTASEIADAIEAETARTESTYLKSADLSDYTTKDDVNNSISAATSSLASLAQLETHTGDTNIHVTTVEKSTWNGKQDALVSGTNIKTINGESILGTGNIVIQGGGGSTYTAGSGITINNNVISIKPTIIGSTTVSSISNIPISNRAVLATISSNGTLSFNGIPEDGYEVHVIIRNSGSSTITVTLPSSGSYVCTSENIIYIASNKYGEVNILSIGGIGYIHGINSI